MNQIERFLLAEQTPQSYFAVLQRFLRKKRKKLSSSSIQRLYYTLHPIGKSLDNPNIKTMTKTHLTDYIDKLWLRHAPDTIKTVVGDVRHFFKWCKRKGHHRNIAKKIKPIRKQRQSRRAKAPESSIKDLMQYLVAQLDHLVYRDVFSPLCAVPQQQWRTQDQKALRDLFILVFLYETGARAGELSRLGTKVMGKATKQPNNVYQITLYGKTKDRDMSFTERTAELWRIWCQIRPEVCEEYAVIGWGSGHKPGPLKTSGISQMLVRRCEDAQIPTFRAHALRRAKINRSRKTVSLEVASLLVDHSNISTTRNYVDIDDDEMTSAIIATGLKLDIWKRR